MTLDSVFTSATFACAVTGRVESLTSDQRSLLMYRGASRGAASASSIRDTTAEIIAKVRANGDDAVREFRRTFDGAASDVIEVPTAECDKALDAIDKDVRTALERAAQNIETVHRAMRPEESRVSPRDGVVIVRRPDPLDRVGVYAPGGRAAYPSSLLMGAVPARAAGVREVVVCSPPSASGYPLPIVLAAARIAQVDRVFGIGGASAIAAMAYGTATVPRVDRIVGPGNAFVAEAKLQVVNQVAIDSPAGPSELLIIAEATADARRIAYELVAQAEHDPDAVVAAVVVGDRANASMERIARALDELLSVTPRAAIVRDALAANGALLTADDFDAAIDFANAFAAEHLLLCTADGAHSADIVGRLRNTGTIFVGTGASVSFGDYMTGANHVLPTGGLARAYSGLSSLDFVRWTTWQEVSTEAARSLADDTARLAQAEGLPAHAAAARYAARMS
jgi:histidinol dehydrogenase